MTARSLVALGLFLPASVIACIGSGSSADSRWEGPGCQPGCVADDYDLPGRAVCETPDFATCSNSGAMPVCPGGKTPSCVDGPPECDDGSKPSGCQ
jgi:hypothetical protein